MKARIGLDHYSIASRGFSAEATLDFARVHRFDGVQFLEPASIVPSLEPARLAAFRRRAEGMGLYIEVGLPSPNPVRRSRELGHDIAPRELARELEPQVDALAHLECAHARLYVGDRHDRFRMDTPWDVQVASTVEVIHYLTPMLKERGIRLAIETHADVTAAELLGILERLDPEIGGVTLDTGNLLMRLDDPLAAVQRLAPFVRGTHIKDAVLAFTRRGLCWQARPAGSGILPMPDMLATILRVRPSIALSIELHPRIYDLPIYDPRWLAFFPDLRPDSLAAVVRLAAECERRYAEGSLPRPEVVEATPWAGRDLDGLASSLGYLRSVVPTLLESACDPTASEAALPIGEPSPS
ncbi:MAG: sugar phosphate isomerase/epimerase family protein [Isosphaeraceae bacterium]